MCHGQVLGVEDAFGASGQQRREHALTFGKPRSAEVEPVDIEHIERVVEHAVAFARS
jgi:hypothetical protein